MSDASMRGLTQNTIPHLVKYRALNPITEIVFIESGNYAQTPDTTLTTEDASGLSDLFSTLSA